MKAILAALALSLACAAPAWAASTTTVVTPMKQFKGQAACQCLKDKFCWSLVLTGFGEILKMRLGEIEAAPPNRFFPDSMASALGRMDENSDFLKVVCGASRAPCDENRDELEKRVIYSAFLDALPEQSKKKILFDPDTWAITDDGESLMKRSKKCRPGLMVELAGALKKTQRGGPR